MFKHILNFLFGTKKNSNVSVELNAIEVSAQETVKPIKDVHFPVTALAEKTKKARNSRELKKPKVVTAEAGSINVETAESKPKKRRYYKPRKKKADTSLSNSSERSL